ncbi:hypothetical protein FPZ49_27995 [Paenibacillus cremeus]|uniref:Uncharacterized protein n=2 Tax=Paenibacillus cremeus TaxID=2163881 RepID=A0A559K3I1_9BACL|nr:hypothetical protein FPZ49_27995 [Paenibacillus cremeus]
MEYVFLYILIWWSMLVLGLTFFRFQWTSYITPLILSVIPLTFISVMLQIFGLVDLTAIIQPLCAIACFGLIFRFKWVFSLIMVVIPFAVNIVWEFLLNYAVTWFDMNQVLHNLKEDNQFSVGFLISIMNFLLIYVLIKQRWGFSFIPRSSKQPIGFKNGNEKLLAFVFSCFFFIGLSSLAVYYKNQFYIWTMLMVLFIWLLLLRVAFRKDLEE